MKKIILILLILFCSGCSHNKNMDNYIEDKEEEVLDEYVDDNVIKLGLFLYDNNYNNKERIEDTYFTSFSKYEDIGSFEVFLTDDRVVNGNNFKDVWNKYYNLYEDIANYKIGFNIKFILEDGTNFNGNFLKPDIYKFSDYFYVYLYDDIHVEDGKFYSHLEEVKEDTLLTSIKIYASLDIDKVANIILSAFTYDGEEDFDSEGNYRGNSIYVIRIKRNG